MPSLLCIPPIHTMQSYPSYPYHTMPSLLCIPPIHIIPCNSIPSLLSYSISQERSHGTARTPFYSYHTISPILTHPIIEIRSDPMPSYLILSKPSHTRTHTLSLSLPLSFFLLSPSFFYSLVFLSPSSSLLPFLSLPLPLFLPPCYLSRSLSFHSFLPAWHPPALSSLPSLPYLLTRLLHYAHQLFHYIHRLFHYAHQSFHDARHCPFLHSTPHHTIPLTRPSHPLPPYAYAYATFSAMHGSDEM